MINMFEFGEYGVAFIDCGDGIEEPDIDYIDWSTVKVGDVIKSKAGEVIGTVVELGDKTVTVE